MVVAKIQEHIAAYQQWLHTTREHPNLWWWESVQHFQNHWNTDTGDLSGMIDASLYNTHSRRLWQGDHWRPKELIVRFASYRPLMVKAMFDDLFNETKDADMRVSRFIFGMDTLLQDYKQDHPTSIENNHYHDDYRMIALYLAFRYPESYAAPYDFARFKAALWQLGARELPVADDLMRFFKVHRTLTTFIDKSPAIASWWQKHLHPKKHFTGKSLMIAVDFTQFVADRG